MAPKAEWGIEKIRSAEAWNVAGNGEGAVVGIIDTGARHTHEAIKDSYRGGNQSWYDPYRNSVQPRDGNGHGTHVAGTIVGINGIGVAPGAKWLAWKGLTDSGRGFQRALVACGEFMLCPHLHDGTNPNCSLAPHVVSNSWTLPSGLSSFDPVIEAWHAANIIPVFAAGNTGPNCSTLVAPAESTSRTIIVGATDISDKIAVFSSRSPSPLTHALKPDITAPGVNIRSAWKDNDTSYELSSGTSMACPHVSGVVAILKANRPYATFDAILNSLTSAAATELTFGSSVCGGIQETHLPNYVFGNGRLDALGTVRSFLESD